MKGSGQFCPVALAAEIFAERWTPLILRELLAGGRRFAHLHYAIWVLRRLVRVENPPLCRVVICFRFRQNRNRRFWLVLNRPGVDLCLKDPGFETDVQILADLIALADICFGHLSFQTDSWQGKVAVSGLSHSCNELPNWIGVTRFAKIGEANSALHLSSETLARQMR